MMSLSFFGAMALSLGGCGYSYSKMHGSKFNIGPRLRHYGQHDAATLLFLAQPQSSWRVISRTSHRRQQRYNHATTTTTTTELHASKSTSSEKKDANPPIDLTTLRKLVSQSSELHDKNLALSSISQDQLQSRLSDLERESSTPDFWDASNSARNEVVTREIARYAKLIEEVELWGRLRMDAVGALELLEELLVESSNSSNNSSDNNPQSSSKAAEDEEMIALTMEECESCARQLLDLSQKYELTTLLSGPYDASNCRLVLTAGAGGTEACDWVSMLYRMYSRHATYMDMKMTTLDESAGDVVGYKSVELLVEGTNAYGWFKGEKGAHRLVRLSPFNANNKRQTTFAGVDVIPVLDDEEVRDIDIPEKELEISTMRSGGKGGQNVNKVETGVRIKHVPSGIAVKCTQERSQSMNKQLALGRLKAQLLAIAQEQQLQSLKEIRGDIVEASWGAQIRNYVMQPYKMVKDARSSWETSDIDGVLDGGGSLEEFVGAWLRWTRAKEEKEREEMELEV
ncbi:hypothetical protein ACHAXR_003443 [Thalassiosira sp. AJA248-18]